MPFRRTIWYRVVLAAAGAVAVAVLALGGLSGGVFAGFDAQLSDRFFPTRAPAEGITVVGIDGKAIDAYGTWPWPRSLQADLLGRIAGTGARLIVYDVVLAPEAPGDDALVAALASARNVVLASLPNVKPVEASDVAQLLPRVAGITDPAGALAQRAAAVGHAGIAPHDDGVLRSLPILLESADRFSFVPSLSLAAYGILTGVSLKTPTARPIGVQLDDRLVVAPRGSLRINYSGDLTPRDVVSAADVLRGNARGLDGKVVFVGITDQATESFRLVPPDKRAGYPGVLIHANALNTMLTGDSLSLAGTGPVVMWTLLVALLVLAGALLLPVWSAGPVLVASALASVFVSDAILMESGTVPRLVYPLAGSVAGLLIGLGTRYVLEGEERRLTASFFGQFVPRPVVERLLAAGRADALRAGERLDITVLFCDMRGFTAFAADLDPPRVRDVLNVYYERLGDLIRRHEGTLMQYVGDEIFAVFGAPEPRDDHAAAAVACAREMVAARADITRATSTRDGAVRYGIGVNSGEVVAGLVGADRLGYAVTGDSVNVGARLCSLAEADEVVLSQATLDRLPAPPEVQWLGPVELKGVDKGFRAYRLGAAGAPGARRRKPSTPKARRLTDS